MPNTTVYTNNQYYQDIAAAIRRKNGLTTSYKPSEMAPAIDALIVSGGTINLQNRTVTPSTSAQVITASSGYHGLGTVTVQAIPTDFVGSAIPRNPTLTVSGPTVTAPAGYYTTASSKTVGTATVGTISVGVNSSGLVTATATAGEGYFVGGTKTATLQLSAQSGTTITPSTTAQTAVASGKYTTGTVTVASVPTDTNNTFTTNGTKTPASGKWFSSVTINVPMGADIENQDRIITPSESVQVITASSGYTGLGTVTVNAISSTYVGSGVTTKTGTTIIPSTVTQTAIATGQYATGDIKVAGDVNLISSNIKSGVSIFGVPGTFSISNFVHQDEDGYIVLSNEGDNGLKFDWATSVYIETIEANNITNTTDAKAYFDNKYTYKYAILLSPLTTNNQIVMMGVSNTRWRNGSITGATIGTNYDGILVAGTQYLILNK